MATHSSILGASLVAQMVKRLPAMQETRVRSLGWEDPLVKEMATHSSILAWKISWMEPGRLQSMGSRRVGQDWATSLHFTSLHFNTIVTFLSIYIVSYNLYNGPVNAIIFLVLWMKELNLWKAG